MRKHYFMITAFISFLIMTISLASCTKEQIETISLDNDGANAEANSGIQGIVYAIPDGWKQTGVEVDEFSTFSKDGLEYTLEIFATNQEQLSTYDDEEISQMKIQDYYKKYVIPDKKRSRKDGYELNSVKICGTDAYYQKRKNDSGYVEASTCWMLDGVIYEVSLLSWDYEGEEIDSSMISSMTPFSKDDLAEYEYILASIKVEDGSVLQSEEVTVDSLGEIRFDTPAGFKGVAGDSSFADFEKKDGTAIIEVSMTRGKDLNDMMTEDESAPETLKEYYESILPDDKKELQIAGYDGYISLSEEENGKIYYGSAGFFTDNAVYEIRLDSGDDSLWDSNGNLKEDAIALTDDEIKAFEDFLKTIKKK